MWFVYHFNHYRNIFWALLGRGTIMGTWDAIMTKDKKIVLILGSMFYRRKIILNIFSIVIRTIKVLI